MRTVTVAALAAAVLSGAAVPPAARAATISPADRAAIDHVLDVFIPAAVARRHPERAWPLATAAMHLGGDRAGWAHGSLPVPPFPVAGTSFHGWTVDRALPGRADLVLLVHLRKGAPLGAVSIDIAMRKIHGRWLVDSAIPAATFSPAGADSQILAQPDFAPSGGQPFSRTGRISEKWVLIIPGVLFALIVLTPVAVFVGHRLRDRRARRQAAESDHQRVFRSLPERTH
jgi:hypothetical protein